MEIIFKDLRKQEINASATLSFIFTFWLELFILHQTI